MNKRERQPPRKVSACICPTCFERNKRALPYKCQHCNARSYLVDTTTDEGKALVEKRKQSGKRLTAGNTPSRVGTDQIHWTVTGRQRNQPKVK